MPAIVERNSPEEIHPAIWRASQLARGDGRSIATGYASLSAELPGGGWPLGALIELLPQHSGIGSGFSRFLCRARIDALWSGR
jgi:protein ImuA